VDVDVDLNVDVEQAGPSLMLAQWVQCLSTAIRNVWGNGLHLPAATILVAAD